jgi:predicted component of type VI protein secretion system
MSISNRKGFQSLDLGTRATLIGQLLLTTGTAFLSLGQIFKLLKNDQLPTTPINSQKATGNERPVSLYGGRRSYFED